MTPPSGTEHQSSDGPSPKQADSDQTGTAASARPNSTPGKTMSNGSLIFWLFIGVALLAALNASPKNLPPAPAGTFAIAIHGGAGSGRSPTDEQGNIAREMAMKEALEVGKQILASGGTSLDAVERVIVLLENDPLFNAGKGAVFNAAGNHELDASIMDGSTKSCGAVAGVTTVKNPISLARLVMTETRHVLLAGQGAEEFAKMQETERVENEYFSTPSMKARWEKSNQRRQKQSEPPAQQRLNAPASGDDENKENEKAALIGTVGCVALDQHGNLAAGTSTGGLTNKKYGRIGDSPIVGAGTFADNETCAVSGTGIGEQYIRNSVAYDIAAQIKYKKATVQEALDDNLQNRLQKNDGGLIAIDRSGSIATGTNTAGMLRGVANSDGLFEVSW